MGQFRWGPPPEVTKALRDRYQIECFFETGTNMGDTSLWAAEQFPKVVTVELSDEFFRAATERFADNLKITALNGDSSQLLAELGPSLPTTLFWLDAHYSGGPTAGVDHECPLLEEIDAIAADLDRHFVMIDDARMFVQPPPPPHRTFEWPTIEQVAIALTMRHAVSITVFDDIILAVPNHCGAEVLALLKDSHVDFIRVV